MMMISIFFYVFALCLILGCLGIILSKNTIHSVFYLIFSFFNAAALLVLLKAEFIAVILIMIYIGAISVFFIFILLLINIKEEIIKSYYSKYLIIGLVLIAVLSSELYVLFYNGTLILFKTQNLNNGLNINSIMDLGNVLFSHYYYILLLFSLILLIAMVVVVILLVPSTKVATNSQSLYIQNLPNTKKGIDIVKHYKEKRTEIE